MLGLDQCAQCHRHDSEESAEERGARLGEQHAMSRRALRWTLVALGLLAAPAFAADTVYYYSSDTLHSAVVVTDQNRNVVERTTHYAPYGQVLNRDLRDGPGYTGHEEDPETGLVYMQQRYYDPEAGRFLSTDPVQVDGGGGSFNRYEYAKDNPYRYTDPFGMYECSGSKTNCTTVANFYNAAVKSLGNMKQGSDEYKATAAAVKYLGKPGEKNGVTVTVKALSGNERGNAAKRGNISIDVAKINHFGALLKQTGRDSSKTTGEVQNAVGAGVLMHEATHEVDYLNPNISYPHSEAADRALETHAYTVERGVGAALGMDEIGLSTQHEFDSAVQGSVNTFCSNTASGCQ